MQRSGRLRRPRPERTRADRWQRWTNIGGLISVLLVGIGLYITGSFNREQAEATRRQLEIAVQGQQAERFVKAIDQLGQEGKDKISIRLGGIYALERLMRESSEYRPTVIEVLSSFIRQHSPRSAVAASGTPASPTDIRAAFTVLGRRPDPFAGQDTFVDVGDARLGLGGMRIRDARFSNIDLRGSNLSGARFDNVVFLESNFAGADLRKADIGNICAFVASDFRKADLRGAVFSSANLGDDYETPDLEYDETSTLFRHVSSVGSNFDGASMSGSRFRVSKLTKSRFVGADLRKADLSLAELNDANLEKADLRGADLRGADLSRANLHGADLRGADLRKDSVTGEGTNLATAIGLTSQQLAGAIVDSTTVLPDKAAPKGTRG
ncbi:hypothetical protein Adi01nite_30240 [Amorphoplanes digitatis]|nr:hypothetical protein Adi01nite_30240 [Actinoplanes digitatis]